MSSCSFSLDGKRSPPLDYVIHRSHTLARRGCCRCGHGGLTAGSSSSLSSMVVAVGFMSVMLGIRRRSSTEEIAPQVALNTAYMNRVAAAMNSLRSVSPHYQNLSHLTRAGPYVIHRNRIYHRHVDGTRALPLKHQSAKPARCHHSKFGSDQDNNTCDSCVAIGISEESPSVQTTMLPTGGRGTKQLHSPRL